MDFLFQAFAGFVSFLDTFEPLGATHGNRGIVETALKEKADKVLFNTPVRSVEFEEQSGQYLINNQDKFDYVVVAGMYYTLSIRPYIQITYFQSLTRISESDLATMKSNSL